ncbi:outer membrane protein, cobalt-zinc-cadmium efflux system [Fodinibius salinus]|uniref:Outer membrane protein, cobalt-zinc-cadmium efflux system n=1 Tax=Fodinibius salinus TaxID=860790 RepID=A0A5D3YN80_9BACT|nr:TolC family protein [Fodinibius salinus]TYP93609.1 outer membrane protein, cobalt-zinc-cadmium efflux system [Fodinibius salinus]
MAFSIVLAILVSFQPTQSDTTNLNSLSVGKALEIAYQHNPRINQLKNRIEAQRQQQSLSLGIQDPEVTYAKEGIGQGTFAEQRWVVSQSLDFPLTGYYRSKSQKANTRSMELELQALKLQLKADVKSAYTKLAYAIESSHLARERVDLFKSLRDAAKARADLGESSKIDAMQANLQLTEAQNNMEKAHQDIMDARYNLFETIGLDEEQTYEIGFPDTLHYVAVDINQNEVLRQLQQHPQLQQISKDQLAASYQTKVAQSGYLPDINLKYYRQDFGNGFDFNGFEIGVSIPLWFGINQSNQVQQSKARYSAVEWQYQEEQLSLKKQAEQAWHGYETTRANIKRYRESIQAKSKELVDMTQKGYRMGELNLLTLLEAQRTYLRTQQAYYETLRDYYLRVIELEKYIQKDIIFK